MATATNQAGGITIACTLHPVTLTRAEKVPSSVFFTRANVRSSKRLRCRNYLAISCDSFPSDQRHGPCLKKNQQRSFRALSLQAVTADNDSEGSSAPGPSSQDYTCIWQDDKGAKQLLIEWLQGLQVWFNTIRKQSLTQSMTEVLKETKEGLLHLDTSKVDLQLKSSKLNFYTVQWWKNTEPWIKWPVAIFVPWYLLVTIVYGVSVSRDLFPLWILGPISTALVIEAGLQLIAFCRKLPTSTAGVAFTARLIYLYEDAKSGQLPQHLKESVESHIKELKELAAKKRADMELYLKSGQAMADMKQLLQQNLSKLWNWSVDKYEDFRVYWLVLSLRLKNII